MHKPLPPPQGGATPPPMSQTPDIHAKAETLIEALPYFQRYAGRSFVVKYGGNAMGDERAAREFAEDVVLLRAVELVSVLVVNHRRSVATARVTAETRPAREA